MRRLPPLCCAWCGGAQLAQADIARIEIPRTAIIGSPWRLRHYVVNMPIRTSDDVGQLAMDADEETHAKGL